MPPGMKAWLAGFVVCELEATLAWSNSEWPTSQSPERAKDARFVDDGSNFRSSVNLGELSEQRQLQIQRILTLDRDYAEVIVSDGFTTIKATLNGLAIEALKTELGSDLNLETQGDVFSVKKVVTTSSSVGFPDELILLELNDIEYLFTLRRLQGSPTAIQDRQDIQSLLRRISESRQNQLKGLSRKHSPSVAIKVESEEPTLGNVQPSMPSHSLANALDKDIAGKNGHERDARSELTQSQAVSKSIQSQSFPFKTQLSSARTKRDRTELELASDGIEIVEGINVVRPTSRFREASDIALDTTDQRKSRIRALIAQGPAQSLHRAPAVLSSETLGTRDRIVPAAEAEPARTIDEVAKVSKKDPVQVISQAMPDSDGQVGEEIQASSAQDVLLTPLLDGSIEADGQLLSPGRCSTAVLPTSFFYGRRRVPEEQRLLLDRSSAFYPPLPGQTFPIPNVPIKMLAKMKTLATDMLINKDREQRRGNIPEAAQTAVEQPMSSHEVIPDLDRADADLDEDEEMLSDSCVSSKHWPPSSPHQPVQQLPPDSSGRPSTPSPQHSLTRRTRDRAPNNDRQALRPAPEASLSLDSSPIASTTRSPAVPVHETPLSEFQRPSPNTIPQTLERARSLIAESPPSKISSSVVIPKTPLNDQVENARLSVPSTQRASIDPAILHRQRRSELFARTERRNWLSEEHVLVSSRLDVPGEEHDEYDIVEAYRKTRPHISLDYEAIWKDVLEVFPTLAAEPADWRIAPKSTSIVHKGNSQNSITELFDGRPMQGLAGVMWKRAELPSTASKFNEFTQAFYDLRPSGFLHQHTGKDKNNNKSEGQETNEPAEGYQVDILNWHF